MGDRLDEIEDQFPTEGKIARLVFAEIAAELEQARRVIAGDDPHPTERDWIWANRKTIELSAQKIREQRARIAELEQPLDEARTDNILAAAIERQTEWLALDRAADGIGNLDICYGCRDIAANYVLGLKERTDG